MTFPSKCGFAWSVTLEPLKTQNDLEILRHRSWCSNIIIIFYFRFVNNWGLSLKEKRQKKKNKKIKATICDTVISKLLSHKWHHHHQQQQPPVTAPSPSYTNWRSVIIERHYYFYFIFFKLVIYSKHLNM